MKNNLMAKIGLFLPLLLSVLLVSAVPAYATFIVDPDPFHTGNTTKLYLDGTVSDVSSFSGHVGDQNTGPVVDITTNAGATVDVASGYATIASETGLLTSLTFIPEADVHFGDFSFRFQLNPVDGDNHATQDVNVLVNSNDGPFSFDFSFIKTTGDLGPIGVISTDGEWIESVVISTLNGFDQVKQIDFSLAETEPIPEPGTVLLFGAGLLVTFLVKRRATS